MATAPTHGEAGNPRSVKTLARLSCASTELIENQPIAATVLMSIGSTAPNCPKLVREAMMPAVPVFGPMMLASPTTAQPKQLPMRMAQMAPVSDRPLVMVKAPVMSTR